MEQCYTQIVTKVKKVAVLSITKCIPTIYAFYVLLVLIKTPSRMCIQLTHSLPTTVSEKLDLATDKTWNNEDDDIFAGNINEVNQKIKHYVITIITLTKHCY